jgi:hypothetical protein
MLSFSFSSLWYIALPDVCVIPVFRSLLEHNGHPSGACADSFTGLSDAIGTAQIC